MSGQLTESTNVVVGRAEASTANHDVAVQPRDGEKRIVAIFRRDVSQAAALAGSFKEAGIEATTLVSAEALAVCSVERNCISWCSTTSSTASSAAWK